MVKLYTRQNRVPNGVTVISRIDSYFNQVVLPAVGVAGLPKKYLLQFDGAEVYTNDRVSTKFGLCSATMLSTGLKTLCVVMYCKQEKAAPRGIVLTECGKNILEAVFAEMENTDLIGVLNHADVFGCSNRVYTVNDRQVSSIDALRALLQKEVYNYGR